MTIVNIRKSVIALRKKFGNISPEDMCDKLGILIMRYPMGRKHTDCKGFFMRKCRISMIVINSDLDEVLQRIVLYHELGHAILHANTASECTYHDFEVFDETDQAEFEANIFAAELALPDDVFFEYMNADFSLKQAAAALNVPVEFIDFKFRVLKRLGSKVIPPLYARSDFMKSIDVSDRL